MPPTPRFRRWPRRTARSVPPGFRLERLPRAAKVTNISITRGGGAGPPGVIPTNLMSMQPAVEFYTTDTSAGPGSERGQTGGGS